MRDLIASLSPRQLEVMQLVARRLSSKEIALVLRLSPATVDSHIAAALQRMQLRSRRGAVIRMIELGYVAEPIDTVPIVPTGFPEGHHGSDQLPKTSLFTSHAWRRILRLSKGRDRPDRPDPHRFEGKADERQSHPIKPRMAPVVVRFSLDALYISFFFAVMSAVAFGAHWVVIQCAQRNIDPVVLVILRGVSYMLAGLDAIGVVTATGILIFRFIRATMRVDE